MNKAPFIFLVIAFVSLVVLSAIFGGDKEKVSMQKLDDCINVANKIALDPNDNQRPEFLQNCYESK